MAALDPSIILGVKPLNLQQPDPIERYTKLAGVQEIMGKLADADQTRADDQAVRDAYKQSGGDSATLRKLLTDRGSYKQIQALDKADYERRQAESTITRNTAQAGKANWEVDAEKAARGASLMGQAKDPESWEQVIRLGQAQGLWDSAKADMLRQMGYSPERVQALQRSGMTYVQQLEAQNKADTLKETARGHDLTATTAREGHAVTARGQDIVAGTTRRGQDLTDSREAVQYVSTPTGIVAVPKRTAPGQAPTGRVVTDAGGQPLGGTANADAAQRKQDAKDVVGIITQALPLLNKAHDSYLGTATGIVGQTFGVGSVAQSADAQLKVLAGSLVSKMPKMSGPQSDRDVQLYREMAGELGDSTKPAQTRRAALGALLELQKKYGVEIPPELEAQINPPRTTRRGTRATGANPANLSDAEIRRELERK